MYPPLGRPREFKFKMREELVNYVASGESVERAAKIVGVSLRTVQREAKHNEEFHHDLELAKQSAPSDLKHQMMEAARTHWRAAAWLLEREDPERFGKRPANSCSPAMLRDACDFLIEKALEATPPEHHEAVYRRMRTAADQMHEVIMPDRSIERRCLASVLSRQTTPLSCQAEDKLRTSPEYLREQESREFAMRPWQQVERLLGAKRRQERTQQTPDGKPPHWLPTHDKRLDSKSLDASWHYPTEEQVEAYYDRLDEKRGLATERVAQRERDRELLLAALDRHQQEKQKKKMPSASNGGAPTSAKPADAHLAEAKPANAHVVEANPANAKPAEAKPANIAAPVPPPVYGLELSDCVSEDNCEASLETSSEGLMSPKTCFGDKSRATKCHAAAAETAPGDEPRTNLPPDFDIEERVRECRAEILARMNQERRQAG
jgi:hypothetical protein